MLQTERAARTPLGLRRETGLRARQSPAARGDRSRSPLGLSRSGALGKRSSYLGQNGNKVRCGSLLQVRLRARTSAEGHQLGNLGAGELQPLPRTPRPSEQRHRKPSEIRSQRKGRIVVQHRYSTTRELRNHVQGRTQREAASASPGRRKSTPKRLGSVPSLSAAAVTSRCRPPRVRRGSARTSSAGPPGSRPETRVPVSLAQGRSPSHPQKCTNLPKRRT